MKVVRELGLERRKTVRSLSIVKKESQISNLVREDRQSLAYSFMCYFLKKC